MTKWLYLKGLWHVAVPSPYENIVIIAGAEQWNRHIVLHIPGEGLVALRIPFDYRYKVKVADWILTIMPEIKKIILQEGGEE